MVFGFTGICRVRVNLALVFSVVLCAQCLSFVSFLLAVVSYVSDLTIFVCLFGIFDFFYLY